MGSFRNFSQPTTMETGHGDSTACGITFGQELVY